MRLFSFQLTVPALTIYLIALVVVVSAQKLQIEVTKAVDCTRKTENGDTISVHYRGTLQDGTVFDESYKRGSPFKFTLGTKQVIRGWDEGLLGMCIGEGRKLVIPPAMAYGNTANGPIPPGSTLIFETELMAIQGVVQEEAPPQRPTIEKPEQSDDDDQEKEEESSSLTAVPTETPEAVTEPPVTTSVAEIATASPVAAAQPTRTNAASPMDADDDNGECHLLGSYALFVQGALGLLALSSLVYKRWRETPRRPLKIWFFDVSKQVFGSVLLHLANILMSMLSSGRLDVSSTAATTGDEEAEPNPCSWYLLNLAVDTTIGIPILVILLKLLHRAFLLTAMAKPPESIRSGNYGHPPRATWWLKQSIIYFLGLFGMKLCVFVLFQLLPWIAWVGDWALRWTEGNTTLQITFVMFVFPLVMNALQYWIIDGFIKDRNGDEGGYVVAAGEDESEDGGDEGWLERHRRSRRRGEEGGRRESEEEDVERVASQPLKEANPTPLPMRKGGKGREYDPRTDGERS